MIWACIEAFQVTGEEKYLQRAEEMVEWFSGKNIANQHQPSIKPKLISKKSEIDLGNFNNKYLQGYNIYHSFNWGPFVLFDFTTDKTWTHEDLPTGHYAYYVTAIYDEGESIPSDTVSAFLTNIDGNKIIDIGSGAGIPGIPMAIELEKCNVTLVESVKKKSTFLNNARENLNLENLEIINQRAELLGQDRNYREKFNFAVSRALGGFGTTLELLAPFVKVDGATVIFRGTNEKYKLNLNEIKKDTEVTHGEIKKSQVS